VEGRLFKCAGFLFRFSRTSVQVPSDSCSTVPGYLFKFLRITVQIISDSCSNVSDFVFKCDRIMQIAQRIGKLFKKLGTDNLT
jgi:hypothetical protein